MLVGIAFEVDVDTGFQGYCAGVFITCRAAMGGGYAFDALEVGVDKSVEAPLLAQQVGEQISVACARHAVD